MPELDARERKNAWRKLIAGLFALIPQDARHKLDVGLTARLRECLAGKEVRLLLGFAPLPDEPNLSPFFRRWLAEGGRLAMPRWLGGADLSLRLVTDIDSQLRPGRAGILEPRPGLPEVPPEELGLVIAPGRAFSEELVRMGRGSGCYDSLFRGQQPFKVGVAYDFQVFPELPAGAGDVPVDVVVTPSRIVGQA